MSWNPVEALQDVASDRVEGTAGAYRALLQQCPVGRVEVVGSSVEFWGVFAFDELTQAVKDHRTLSNVTPPPDGPRIIPLQTDPPEHTGYRRMLNRSFSVDEVGKLENEVRRYAADMIDQLVEAGTADFATDFAFPFPTRVLCRFLGVRDEDWTVHHDWVMKMAEATGHGLLDPNNPIPMELFAEIMPHLAALIAEHRAAPRDDVVSGIISGEIGGRSLEDMEVVQLIITIMLAGHITTTSGVGNLVLRVARDPELQALLRARPDRIPDAVEESLRLDTPQQAMPRRCTHDTELGGRTIRAGEYVLMNFGSANVDPDAWPDADVFDIDRQNKRHVAFGRGVHQCIGANLARMEMRLALEELLARTSSFAPDGQVRRLTWPLLAVQNLPMTMIARTG